MGKEKIVIDDYGFDSQMVSDGPHALTRLCVRGWPAGVDRFLEKQCIWVSGDPDRDRVYPWNTFAGDPESAPKGKDGDHYDYDISDDDINDDGWSKPCPYVSFDLAVPLPKKFYDIHDTHEVALDTLRGHPPESLRRNILARTGEDISDPALSWQQRYDRCIFAWPAWRKTLSMAMKALDNRKIFGYDTIDEWALKHWGGAAGLFSRDFGRIGNDSVSHRFLTAKDHKHVEFVFLTRNEVNDDFPVPVPIFEKLAALHPVLRIDLLCRTFHPGHGEQEIWRAKSIRGKVEWETPEEDGVRAQLSLSVLK